MRGDDGRMKKRTIPRHGILAALLALLVATAGPTALRLDPAAHAASVPAGDDDDTAEFRSELADESKTVQRMIADTKAGDNLSDFRLGMFVMGLLNNLSDRDDALGGYFHKNGRLMEDYLRNTFQYHSEEEVAHVAEMAKQGNPGIRGSAQYALESLRHIPDDKDPQTQQQDRTALIDSLTRLNDNLAKAAQE